MNYKFIYSVLIIGIMFLYTACTDQGSVVRNYKIINDTTEDVLLEFHSNNANREENKFVFSESISGKGVILERTLETISLDRNNTPLAVYDADSIALIFNNERIEGHRVSNPVGRSLLSLGDYNNEGNNYTYTITQENFDNAIPCDGPCK